VNGEPKTEFWLPKFRGGNRELIYSHDHEVVVVSGADCGKTWAACVKSLILCLSTPKVHGAICRKVHATLEQSVLRTFNTLTAGLPIKRSGGNWTDRYTFPNGSVLVPVGLDHPEKLLSSEWDFVQVCQTEELLESDWEMVASRCTGRGAVVKHPQIFGDANPAGTRHWIRERAKSGKLKLLTATHKDNPALYDEAGNITPEGVKRLHFLDTTLTGVRRQRLLFHQWATAEGAVYDNFNSNIGGPHVHERDPAEMVEWYLCQDDGYTDPAVILLVGADSDRRWHVFREFYAPGHTHKQVADVAQGWAQGFRISADAVDGAAASLVAELRARGINAVGVKANVEDTCHLVRDRLQVAGDGKARLTFDPSCVNTINDFESYHFKPGTDKPAHENSHACDALRYLAIHLSEPTGAFDDRSIAGARIGKADIGGDWLRFDDYLRI